MKTRNGFVSNSSTSSFTCDVCGETYAERDAGLTDAEMYRCANEHTFCESHAVGNPEGEDYEDRYEVSVRFCPICSMTHLTPTEELVYLRKKAGFSDMAATLVAVKAEFPTHDEFTTWLNGPAIKVTVWDGKP